MVNKKLLCVDFDGVIHSYKSGWQGARCIPDPPVDGALEFLADAINSFDVAIFSSRARYFGGRRAMKRWLRQAFIEYGNGELTRSAWLNFVLDACPEGKWRDRNEEAADLIVSLIQWPTKKPAAFLQIDDRAMQFTGTFPPPSSLLDFKPWYYK